MAEKKKRSGARNKKDENGVPLTGRPCKLTPELQERIVQVIATGNYVETAAAFAGISKDTFYNWMKKGARGEGAKFVAFSDAIQKALAQAEIVDVAMIARAAESQWQAAAWRLERRNPERWGRRDRLTVTEAEPIDWSLVPDDVLDGYLDGKLTEDDVRRQLLRARKG